MARVNKSSAVLPSTDMLYLYLLPSHGAPPHFSWYSFSIHLRQEAEFAWVAGYIPRHMLNRSFISVLTLFNVE